MRLVDWTAVALVIWAAIASTPLSWRGFIAGPVIVDAREAPHTVRAFRTIWRDITMSYAVTVRGPDQFAIACEGRGGPFMYRAQPAAVVEFSLADWVGDKDCMALPPGHYTMDTTWAHYLNPPLLPPRTVTVQTEFTVEARP